MIPQNPLVNLVTQVGRLAPKTLSLGDASTCLLSTLQHPRDHHGKECFPSQAEMR